VYFNLIQIHIPKGPRSEPSLPAYLKTYGPLAIAVDADDWQFYSSGIKSSCGWNGINHSVVIVGYGTGFWIIKNSWGAGCACLLLPFHVHSHSSWTHVHTSVYQAYICVSLFCNDDGPSIGWKHTHTHTHTVALTREVAPMVRLLRWGESGYIRMKMGVNCEGLTSSIYAVGS
jgi:hypothetical protein